MLSECSVSSQRRDGTEWNFGLTESLSKVRSALVPCWQRKCREHLLGSTEFFSEGEILREHGV